MALKGIKIKVTKDNTKDLIKRVKQLTNTELLIGVPESKTSRTDEVGVTNAFLAKLHSDGSPINNIPSRPIIPPTIERNKKVIENNLKNIGISVLNGNDSLPLFHKLGLIMQSELRKTFVMNDWQPLSPRTIRARAIKGFTGTRPLIRTAQLRRSFTYVINKKGDK